MNIAVVGLGLIGGSIAKSLKAKTSHTVFGMDISETVMCRAELTGAIDHRLSEENLGECDVVIVALYPEAVIKYVEENSQLIKLNAIVIDTGGIKTAICKRLDRVANDCGFTFIGAHPMAGLEHSGFDSSVKSLFENASMILTPPGEINLNVMEKLKKLCTEIGFSKVVITTPRHHDEMIAYTSQLAHVVSSAFVQSPKALSHKGYSAGSYRDMTRVATLNEYMWTELFLSNSECLLPDLDGIIGKLTSFRDAIAEGDGDALTAMLREGREQKEKADGKVL
ncbi:MAG: prephenate dehydrogenase [Oscillospiraceae bacterium]|jgi:prephenate dehydrogenase|nr:prephenate dehydrogenase [Oscillospiraceae bacterium]